MNMNGMYKEDAETKSALEGLRDLSKLKDEADVVLEGNADTPNQNYEVTKPEGGYNGVTNVANPYDFAQEVNPDVKVLVIHGDGSFDRYNHTTA